MSQKILLQKSDTSKGTGKVQSIKTCAISNTSDDICRVPRLWLPVYIRSSCPQMELDTATGGNFISEEICEEIGKPELRDLCNLCHCRL